MLPETIKFPLKPKGEPRSLLCTRVSHKESIVVTPCQDLLWVINVEMLVVAVGVPAESYSLAKSAPSEWGWRWVKADIKKVSAICELDIEDVVQRHLNTLPLKPVLDAEGMGHEEPGATAYVTKRKQDALRSEAAVFEKPGTLRFSGVHVLDQLSIELWAWLGGGYLRLGWKLVLGRANLPSDALKQPLLRFVTECLPCLVASRPRLSLADFPFGPLSRICHAKQGLGCSDVIGAESLGGSLDYRVDRLILRKGVGSRRLHWRQFSQPWSFSYQVVDARFWSFSGTSAGDLLDLFSKGHHRAS
jgi:hypothetical protein